MASYGWGLWGQRGREAERQRGRGAEVLALVRALEVAAPGLVWTLEWRPEPSEQVLAQPSDCYYYALVARKP